MKHKFGISLAVMTLLCGAMCISASAENKYYTVTNELKIEGAGEYTLVLDSNEGWFWQITDNMDVTSWFVLEDGSPAFYGEEGIALTKLVYTDVEDEGALALQCQIIVDTDKITEFAQPGSYDIYILPTEKATLWVYGDTKGQYQDTMEPCGSVVLPEVVVADKLVGTVSGGAVSTTASSVAVSLVMDEAIDDSLIDSSGAVFELLEGDGYYTNQFDFDFGYLGDSWSNGENKYYLGEFSGSFSPQGGDGNGHYNFRIGLSGLTYNGLPLSTCIIRTDFYSFSRTFSITGGSLILDTEPEWASEDEVPVLCDTYPDVFTVTWPVEFDASGITDSDITVTLVSEYDDELVLEAGTDYTVETAAFRTTIVVSYIHWAYAPVYSKLNVEVSLDHVEYDEQMYAPGSSFSHTYDIASVYVYSVMGGGGENEQGWTYYGFSDLTDTHQVFGTATYTLSWVNENGDTWFYAEDEDGNGILVDAEANAIAFDCDEECNVHLEGQMVLYTRLYDQTEVKTVDGVAITFDKNYYNCESLPLPVEEITATTAPGYCIGDGWEDHLKWPWQSFVNEGYQYGPG